MSVRFGGLRINLSGPDLKVAKRPGSYGDKYFPSGSARRRKRWGDRGLLCPLLRQVTAPDHYPPKSTYSSLPPTVLHPLIPPSSCPCPPGPSWNSHRPSYLGDAIASLPFPPAHPRSTGKKGIIFLFFFFLDRLGILWWDNRQEQEKQMLWFFSVGGHHLNLPFIVNSWNILIWIAYIF